MAFVIQDIKSEKYLKHDGTDNDHPYDDVEKVEEAEQFPNYKHACFAAFWYADMTGNGVLLIVKPAFGTSKIEARDLNQK
ncbi:hypothetical protein [Paenibacillus gorillae]|uniref:hypothetical protein n=1 Tax=Paenibacillus gorillae TaxID=1243662 RepID=UPI0004AE866A|nr:hypothetical protein [Paenibacillus gorillae]